MQIRGDYISEIIQFISKPGPGVYRAAASCVYAYSNEIYAPACNTRICVRARV